MFRPVAVLALLISSAANAGEDLPPPPSELTTKRLDFKGGSPIIPVRLMEGSTEVQFTFAPEGAGTKVTWAMQGKKPFIGKIMGLFMDCEKMCGDDFEKGLANLAKVVAGGPVVK